MSRSTSLSLSLPFFIFRAERRTMDELTGFEVFAREGNSDLINQGGSSLICLPNGVPAGLVLIVFWGGVFFFRSFYIGFNLSLVRSKVRTEYSV